MCILATHSNRLPALNIHIAQHNTERFNRPPSHPQTTRSGDTQPLLPLHTANTIAWTNTKLDGFVAHTHIYIYASHFQHNVYIYIWFSWSSRRKLHKTISAETRRDAMALWTSPTHKRRLFLYTLGGSLFMCVYTVRIIFVARYIIVRYTGSVFILFARRRPVALTTAMSVALNLGRRGVALGVISTTQPSPIIHAMRRAACTDERAHHTSHLFNGARVMWCVSHVRRRCAGRGFLINFATVRYKYQKRTLLG